MISVIHKDAGLLVINKPAGLVCHPTKTDALSSLIGRVRLHLGEGSRPHMINRLDRETSGVVVVARTDEAARTLRRAWESRSVTKSYLAIVHGHVKQRSGVIDAALGKDKSSRVAIKDCVRTDGAAAQTAFTVERQFSREQGEFTLLRVHPHTGRKHQIRIHLAHVGHPIVGDKLYGGDEDLYLALVEDRLTDAQRRRLILPCHALHAAAVQFEWQGEQRRFVAEAEEWFKQFASCDP